MVDPAVIEAVHVLTLLPLTLIQLANEIGLPQDFSVGYVARYLAAVRRLSAAAGLSEQEIASFRRDILTTAFDRMADCVAKHGAPAVSASFDQRFAKLRDDLEAAVQRSEQCPPPNIAH
jgi:hypothetical protein